MSRIFEVVTPEQVAIRYELAGFGSRALAALADALIQSLVFLALLLAGLAIFDTGLEEIDTWEKFASSFFTGMFLILVFLIFWGYHIFFESLWNGSTPGKRLLGLRVIKDGGHPVDFRAVVTRNLLRAVDILPGIPPFIPVYGFALISVLCNDRFKRLGDLAAGTIVVRHGGEEEARAAALFGETEVFRLLDPGTLRQVGRLTREEHRLVQRFLNQREVLAQPLRGEFARRLAAPLMEKLEYRPPALGFDEERWLGELELAFRTYLYGAGPAARPAAATPATPAARPPAPPASAVDVDDDERRW